MKPTELLSPCFLQCNVNNAVIYRVSLMCSVCCCFALSCHSCPRSFHHHRRRSDDGHCLLFYNVEGFFKCLWFFRFECKWPKCCYSISLRVFKNVTTTIRTVFLVFDCSNGSSWDIGTPRLVYFGVFVFTGNIRFGSRFQYIQQSSLWL